MIIQVEIAFNWIETLLFCNKKMKATKSAVCDVYLTTRVKIIIYA